MCKDLINGRQVHSVKVKPICRRPSDQFSFINSTSTHIQISVNSLCWLDCCAILHYYQLNC